MLPSPCFIFSDTHLGHAPAQVERDVRGFLRALRGRAGSVVINGDLFEFWFEWRHVMPRAAFRVLAALADLREAGIPVLMVAGNHDCWGGEILRQDVGIDYQVGPWRGELAGWNACVEHGDGLRSREDRRYRMLRAVLRNPLAIGAFRWIHPDLSAPLAGGSSHASRSYAARDGGRGLRDVAQARLAAEPQTELLIFGHSHVPALERMPGRGVYANAGAWLEAPTFLRVTPERVELRRWDGSADGVALDALDRRAQEPLG
ncbi:MAG TPA: UDP-2,3-diacylglucosamine diphosphatase [Gemmatimonadaceae bacterium]|nr:UDP-2,3-diacylglucosamine diphosphatase [Gemmatimonadaceae bacterium]